MQSKDGMEHERRFFPLLKQFPFPFNRCRRTEIFQAYLEDSEMTRIRVEKTVDGVCVYARTRKAGEGISRIEEEIEIMYDEFALMLGQAACYVSKIRYSLAYDGYEVQLNVFRGGLHGYVQIEVEFGSHEAAVAYKPPEWFGVEVTHNSAHSNYSLAKYGAPKQ